MRNYETAERTKIMGGPDAAGCDYSRQVAIENQSRRKSRRSSARLKKVRTWIVGVAFAAIGLPAAVTVPDLLRNDYFELCMTFYPGEGVGGQGRYYEARCLKWAAERGDVSAQAQLGDSYADGLDGVSQDHSEAVRWWQRASQAGDAHAQLRLAHSYFEGRGVEQDHEGAAYWYRRAAEQGPLPALVH